MVDDRLFEAKIDWSEKRPDDKVAEARILNIYERATDQEVEEGMSWYKNVNTIARTLVEDYNLEEQIGPQAYVHVAGVIAVLSPRLNWDENISEAEALIRDGRFNGLKRAEASGLKMLAGEHPEDILYQDGSRGFKVQSFYENIKDPEGSRRVTLDRHMWSLIYRGEMPITVMQAKMGQDLYEWGERRIRTVASELQLVPSQLQAIDWLAWRRILNGKPPEAHEVGEQQLFIEKE